MCRRACSRHQKSGSEASSRDKHRLARSRRLQPSAKQSRGKPEHRDGDGKDIAHLFQIPRRAVRALQRQQRILEDTECVDLADGQMNGECSGRHKPPAETGTGNRDFTIKK